jgi:hypothetical protein
MVVRYLTRKTFVQTLGVAGLGLGLMVSAAGAPSAMAQDREEAARDVLVQLLQDADGGEALQDEELKEALITFLQEEGSLPAAEDEAVARDVVFTRAGAEAGGKRVFFQGGEDLRVEAYNEFTQALADELGIDDPDELDAAIRIAMMAVVDANAGLTKDTAEWQKALIATADAPIGPAYRGHGG